MSFLSSITKDHAIVTLIISSLVSLLSGIIILRINQSKDKGNHSFFLKQEFYINFVVHLLIINSLNEKDVAVEYRQKVEEEMRLLNAELLVKADIFMIREVIKIMAISNGSLDRKYKIELTVKLINQFRKRLRNAPISVHDLKQFLDIVDRMHRQA